MGLVRISQKTMKGCQLHLSVLCLSSSLFLSVSLCLSLTLCVWWAGGEGCLFQFFSDTMPLDLQFKNEIWGTKIFEDELGRKKKPYISFSVWTNLEIHLNNNPNFSRVSCSPIFHVESKPRDPPLCEEQLLHFHQLQ